MPRGVRRNRTHLSATLVNRRLVAKMVDPGPASRSAQMGGSPFP